MIVSCSWEHIDRSDLLKETKGVNFIVHSDEAEVMSNGRKQTFTYVIPKVEGWVN
jgi:hypothetical protein